MSGALGRAKEHAPAEWERIKRRFCDLYAKQNKTLPEVRQTLKDEEGFDATYVFVIHHLVFQPLDPRNKQIDHCPALTSDHSMTTSGLGPMQAW
jgi:hypothetical protein